MKNHEALAAIELNIVEGLWKWIKGDVINNVFYHTVAEIRNNVRSQESIVVKLIKDWNLNISGTPVISYWEYELKGDSYTMLGDTPF